MSLNARHSGTLKNSLFCVADRACFADNRDFYLSRISHLILNLLGDFRAQVFGLLVVNLVCTYNYAQLSTGLNGIGLGYARITHGDSFKIVQTLDISLSRRAPGRAPEIASQTCTIGASREVISISSWWAPMALQISAFSLYFSASLAP